MSSRYSHSTSTQTNRKHHGDGQARDVKTQSGKHTGQESSAESKRWSCSKPDKSVILQSGTEGTHPLKRRGGLWQYNQGSKWSDKERVQRSKRICRLWNTNTYEGPGGCNSNKDGYEHIVRKAQVEQEYPVDRFAEICSKGKFVFQ